MYGTRARVGLIVPSTNSVVEPELHAHAPAGVSFYATRVPVAEVEREEDKVASIVAMRRRVPAAAAELGSLGPAAVVFACTSASFLDGRDVDAQTCEELALVSGVPACTTSTAVVAGLRALGAHRVAVVTPYVEPVAAGAVRYLEQNGFSVTARRDLGLLSNLAKGELAAEVSAGLAREVDRREADAVLISCTNWRTLDGLEDLERVLGLPVVSSNLATLWAGLRLSGVEAPSQGPALMRCGGEVLRERVASATGATA